MTGPTEQPNQNLLRIDKADSLVSEALKVLGEIEVLDTDKRGDKQGCIWTLEGWRKHNLRHLRVTFE